MAPVIFEPEPRYLPIAAVALHLSLAAALTALVGRGLHRSYNELPPAQSIRSRQASRHKLVPAFAALTALSLSLAARSAAQYAELSYGSWASERGANHYDRFPYLSRANLARWLSDTAVYYDALKIAVHDARHAWWVQQADLGMLSWALLVGIEGRRRQIPHLWAYMALAQLVSLSYAQNLFYLALLLTPVPLADGAADRGSSLLDRVLVRFIPPKPAHWCPHPAFFLGLVSLSLGSGLVLPYVAASGRNDTVTLAAAALVTRVVCFALLGLPAMIPRSWGTVHTHPHDAYGSYVQVFRTASLAGLVLHGKASLAALAYSDPVSQAYDNYHHVHGVVPTSAKGAADIGQSDWEATATALARVLGSTGDHPVVASVGNDVLLSGLSLGIWAAVRALESQHILRACWPFFWPGRTCRSMVDDIASLAEDRTAEGESERSASPENAAASKTEQDTQGGGEAAAEEAAYEPSVREAETLVEGDPLPDDDLDWEAAALAWGITTLGGLGCGSAGVFGGECTSR